MRRHLSGRTGMVLTFLLGMVIATAATAGAASLITGKQIKDGSIAAKDLNKALRAQLQRTGTPGPRGLPGVTGDAGPKGEKGDPGEAAPRLFATVNGATGALKFGVGFTKGKRVAAGLYELTAGRSLDGCTAVATIGLMAPTQSDEPQSQGGASPIVSAQGATLTVITAGVSGSALDQSFSAAVFC